MKKLKYIMMKKHLFFVVLALFIPHASFSSTPFSFEEEEEEFEIDIEEKPSFDGYDNFTSLTRFVDAQHALGVIALKNVHLFLNTPLYHYTRPPKRRLLHDQPYLQFPDYTETAALRIVPVVHAAIEQKLVDDHGALRYFVDLEQHYFTEILNDLVADNVDVPGDQDDQHLVDMRYPSIPEILSLFHNIKTQEYKLGCVLQFFKKQNDFFYFLSLPIFYQINNYYLSSKDRAAIENHPLIKDFFEDGDYWDFVKHHLMSDKIGLSDLHINIETTVKTTYKSRLNVGIEIIAPTAFSLKKGIIGTHFNTKKEYPSLDLLNDFISPGLSLDDAPTPYNQQLIIDKATLFGLAALDRLSTIVLEQPLGLQHWNIGLFSRSTLIFTPRFDITSKTGLFVILPGKERRFISFTPDVTRTLVSEITREVNDGDGINDAQATALMERLQAAILEHFFPKSYNINTFPGIIIESDALATYHGDRWTWYTGTNMWWSPMKERILSIDASPTELNRLNKDIATKTSAYQTRIFIGADKNPWKNSPWTYGFRISSSSLSTGISSDISIAGFIRCEF